MAQPERPNSPVPGPSFGDYASGTFYAPGWTPDQRGQVTSSASAPRVARRFGQVPEVEEHPTSGGMPRTRTRSRRRVVSAVVVALVLVALGAVTFANPGPALLLTGATTPLASEVFDPREAHVRQLSPGNCVRTLGSDDGPLTRVDVVPCDRDHVGEVLSLYSFDAGSPWPGAQTVQHAVTQSCSLSLKQADDGFTLRAIVPTEASWRQSDRVGLCLAISPATTSAVGI